MLYLLSVVDFVLNPGLVAAHVGSMPFIVPLDHHGLVLLLAHLRLSVLFSSLLEHLLFELGYGLQVLLFLFG